MRSKPLLCEDAEVCVSATLAGILSNTTPPPGHSQLKVPKTGIAVFPGKPGAFCKKKKKRCWQACLVTSKCDDTDGSGKAYGAHREAPQLVWCRIQSTAKEDALSLF